MVVGASVLHGVGFFAAIAARFRHEGSSSSGSRVARPAERRLGWEESLPRGFGRECEILNSGLREPCFWQQ